MDKRAALVLAGAATALALAGCTGSPGQGASADASPPNTAITSTADSTSSAGSPLATTPSSTGGTTPGAGGNQEAAAPAHDVATQLAVPWDMVDLPDGTTLITERDTGHIITVAHGAAGSSSTSTLGGIPGVVADGEGGLLGLALSPNFASNRHVFLYFTAAQDNRVVRAKLSADATALSEFTPIVTGIPKGWRHNGGRIAFGPDKLLYIGTGDIGNDALSQDRNSLGGKILRVTAAGQPAHGNPFPNSRVYSFGHRNVQGLAWGEDGTLYASEFGQNAWDELNIIKPGANYGWPVVEGKGGNAAYVDPIAQWTTAEASPSGIAVGPDDAVYVAGLRGERILRVDPRTGTSTSHLTGTYGRLRHVRFVGGSSAATATRVEVLTNNTSRGTPRAGDDRLISLPLAAVGAG